MRRALGNADKVAVGNIDDTVVYDYRKCAFHDIETLVFLAVDVRRRSVAGKRVNFGDGIGAARLLRSGLNGVKVAHKPEALPLSCFKDTAARVVQYLFAHK